MAVLDSPLLFERIFLEKVWGGRALERTPGLPLPPGMRVGETWEIVDRALENSRVARGPLQGETLASLMRAHAKDLLGRVPATAAGRFPLLVKYIDASESLSVQVHPDDEHAARLGGGAEGKTEAWYVLAAERGAQLYCGLRPEVTRAQLERAARGSPGAEAVVELLLRWKVAAGDCLLVPGGTLHAIGAGVTLLEVQQNSDTTYRLHDWGRLGLDGKPRATHVEQALAVSSIGDPPRPPLRAQWEQAQPGLRRAPLTRSRSFSLNALGLESRVRLATGNQFQIYVVLRGSGSLVQRGSPASHTLASGDCWLLPAASDYHYVEPAPGGLELLQVLYRA